MRVFAAQLAALCPTDSQTWYSADSARALIDGLEVLDLVHAEGIAPKVSSLLLSAIKGYPRERRAALQELAQLKEPCPEAAAFLCRILSGALDQNAWCEELPKIEFVSFSVKCLLAINHNDPSAVESAAKRFVERNSFKDLTPQERFEMAIELSELGPKAKVFRFEVLENLGNLRLLDKQGRDSWFWALGALEKYGVFDQALSEAVRDTLYAVDQELKQELEIRETAPLFDTAARLCEKMTDTLSRETPANLPLGQNHLSSLETVLASIAFPPDLDYLFLDARSRGRQARAINIWARILPTAVLEGALTPAIECLEPKRRYLFWKPLPPAAIREAALGGLKSRIDEYPRKFREELADRIRDKALPHYQKEDPAFWGKLVAFISDLRRLPAHGSGPEPSSVVTAPETPIAASSYDFLGS